MLSCKEVTRIVASDEYAEAGLWRRLMVRMHHALCTRCRRYMKQLRRISSATRDALEEETQKSDLADLKARILGKNYREQDSDGR